MMVISLMSGDIIAQESVKKISLKKGHSEPIKFQNLKIKTLLQEYDKKAKAHLVGDIYLRISDDYNDEVIVDYYIDNDGTGKNYDTKIYKNYFLTFAIENDNKYLIIEQALFGKPFALSSNRSATIGDQDGLVEVEITQFFEEEGYDEPPFKDNRGYFSNVHYTLQIKVRDSIKTFDFYSSDIKLKGNFTFEIEDYTILILSDVYKNSSALIEMKINKT